MSEGPVFSKLSEKTPTHTAIHTVDRVLGNGFGYACYAGGADPESITEKEARILQGMFLPAFQSQGWYLVSSNTYYSYQFGTPITESMSYTFGCSGSLSQTEGTQVPDYEVAPQCFPGNPPSQGPIIPKCIPNPAP